jgi:murein DD-endopeptidase MepM/ murein hydrolase activator NlpD
MPDLISELLNHKDSIKSVIDYDWKKEPYLDLDLGENNGALRDIDLNDEDSFTNFVFDQMKTIGVPFAVGGYAETRGLYSRSHLFVGEEQRTEHLGVDVWGVAGTPIHAPLPGTVHSFANNAIHSDYGPVVILKHSIGDLEFHTLYGHMSLPSLDGLYEGKSINAGQVIGHFGVYAENFHWPPHLHFQLIIDMQEKKGDYPGVCKKSESSFYLENCPDPSVLLNIK